MNILRLFVNGFLIGIANIIPGMSGGTLALVLGIYERLITALRNIGITTAKRTIKILTFRKEAFSDFQDELRHIDFRFLCILGIGAISAVVILVNLIDYLLQEQHDPTYAFFFGLVLTSILIPLRMLNGFKWKELLSVLVAVTLIVVTEELKKSSAENLISSDKLESSIVLYAIFFGSGAIAISAMILPGISGSFLLLVFGVYFPLVSVIKDSMKGTLSLLKGDPIPSLLDNYVLLGLFAIGCLTGLLLFTRLLNFLLKRFRNVTIAFLIGLMVGSLYGLWPFRSTVTVGDKDYYTAHLIPEFDMNLLLTAGVFLIGCLIIYWFSQIEKETE